MREDGELHTLYRLAALLGGRTVAELRASIDYDEFLHWTAYLALHPEPTTGCQLAR